MNQYQSALIEPIHLVNPAPWVGHIPFAAWVISTVKPKVFVELGSYKGNSYLSFCQTVKALGLDTKCYAVDTWAGDVHSGFYGEDIYKTIKDAHDPHYSEFSELLRMTFDEANHLFSDKSIDLLHIDGLHTYEAVKHDFLTWLPKLTDSAVVLFHDTDVFEKDFGVHQFWQEISQDYPHFKFKHSNGLGVLLVGENRKPELLQIAQTMPETNEWLEADRVFRVLGERFQLRMDKERLTHEYRHEIELLQSNAELKSNKQLTGLKKSMESLFSENRRLDSELRRVHTDFQFVESKLDKIKESTSWRLLKFIFKIENVVRKGASYVSAVPFAIRYDGSIGKMYQKSRRAFKADGVRGLKQHWNRMLTVKNMVGLRKVAQLERIKEGDLVTILTTKHTLYVAQLVKNSFEKVGIQSEIIFEMPESGYSDTWHIVICPQIFSPLPSFYYAFQMEQSVSSQWFTAEYFERLNHAEAIFDYSLINIEYLQKNQIPFNKLYYVPIGLVANSDIAQAPPSLEYDVVFYGDASCPRRRLFLEKLKEKFKVKELEEVFGKELTQELSKAKIIVNIHYYENALLETTRLYECLSLNKLVISEVGSDQEHHEELSEVIDFVAIDDVQKMMERIDFWLTHPDEYEAKIERITEQQQKPDQFQFYFYRFLLAQDIIDYEQFYLLCADYVAPKNDFWCLSLPESIDRRRDFDNDNQYGITVIPGLRHLKGWVGCGLSYKFMMHRARDLKLPQVTICEDDVEFLTGFEKRYQNIQQTLQHSDADWDVFSGLIADLSESTQISSTNIQIDHEKLYAIDELVSTVFNIYHQPVYEKIMHWNPANRDTSNTIDRYIQKHESIQGLIVSPYLVGHKEVLDSTLWGFNNARYSEMIKKSQSLLDEKIAVIGVDEQEAV